MKPAPCIAFAVLLAGCSELGIQPAHIGGILGAAGGGYLGQHIGSGAGRVAATIAGVGFGALFGSAITRKLTESDVRTIENTTQRTLESEPSGNVVPWHNPDTGRSGTVVAGTAAMHPHGPCRAFEQTIAIDGKTERATGAACRRPDGTWEVSRTAR